MIKVLFLGANPAATTKLSLDREVKGIQRSLRTTPGGQTFDLEQEWAVRRSELAEMLLRHTPTILHFGGHGGSSATTVPAGTGRDLAAAGPRAGGLVVHDEAGGEVVLRPEVLGDLIRILRDNLRCVVLNACYSREQAEVLRQHVDCVVGMDGTISDESAIEFSRSFYLGLAFGRSVQESLALGKNGIDSIGGPDRELPQLVTRDGVDASAVRFVEQPGASPQLRVKLKITLDIQQSSFDAASFERALRDVAGGALRDLRIEAVEAGSVRLTLSLPDDEAKRLLLALQADRRRTQAFVAATKAVEVRCTLDGQEMTLALEAHASTGAAHQPGPRTTSRSVQIELHARPVSGQTELREKIAALVGLSEDRFGVAVHALHERRVVVSCAEQDAGAMIEGLTKDSAEVAAFRRREHISLLDCEAPKARAAFVEGRRPQRVARPDNEPAVTWVHLSDLHVGHGDVGHGANQQDVLERLLDDAEKMVKKLGTPDFILVTGDIAFSASASQYQEASRWLRRFCAVVGADSGALALVPGNHDVDRHFVKASPIRRIAHATFAQDLGRDHLDDMLSATDRRDLLGKLDAYSAFEAAHQATSSTEGVWWSREVPTSLGDVLVVGLNTALASCDDKDREHLWLGEVQLRRAFDLLREQGPLALVLAHHPPSWLKDGNAVRDRLDLVPHVLFTGHVHEADASIGANFAGGGILQFSAGAVHNEKGEPQGHGYSWGRLDRRGARYYPRVWSKRHQFVGSQEAHEDGFIEASRLPRPLTRWLGPPRPLPDPVRLEDPFPAGSLQSTLFRAFQIDRTHQWQTLLETARVKRYVTFFLAGHRRQSLPLFVDRARHDFERYVGQNTAFWHVRRRRDPHDPGPKSGTEWMRRIAEQCTQKAPDAATAMLAVAKQQNVLLMLGPIPDGLDALRREAIRSLLSTELPQFLERHSKETRHGFRTIVLVEDELAADSEEQPPLVHELKELAVAAASALSGSVVAMPRAHFPTWAKDIEPMLDVHGALPEVRQEIKSLHNKLLTDAILTFEDFGTLLENRLNKL